MTHSVSELALAFAVVVTIGAGAIAVLPATRTPKVEVAIDPVTSAVQRAEPMPVATEAERIEALQRQLAELAAEQKRLTQTLRTTAQERRAP